MLKAAVTILAIVTCVLAVFVTRADAQQKTSYTLRDCLRIGLERNPDLQRSLH